MLWGSGSCTDGISRAVARQEQGSRHPSPVRDGSSLLLVGPQIVLPQQDAVLVIRSRVWGEELPLPLLLARVGGRRGGRHLS